MPKLKEAVRQTINFGSASVVSAICALKRDACVARLQSQVPRLLGKPLAPMIQVSRKAGSMFDTLKRLSLASSDRLSVFNDPKSLPRIQAKIRLGWSASKKARDQGSWDSRASSRDQDSENLKTPAGHRRRHDKIRGVHYHRILSHLVFVAEKALSRKTWQHQLHRQPQSARSEPKMGLAGADSHPL